MTYREQILQVQQRDSEVSKMRNRVNTRIKTPFRIADDGVLMMGQRVYVHDNGNVKQKILQEAHESKFMMHLGSTKMYQDLKQHFWWPNMKREVVNS